MPWEGSLMKLPDAHAAIVLLQLISFFCVEFYNLDIFAEIGKMLLSALFISQQIVPDVEPDPISVAQPIPASLVVPENKKQD
jgi:hypothetical protein